MTLDGLTRDAVYNEPAGRRLDAWVALCQGKELLWRDDEVLLFKVPCQKTAKGYWWKAVPHYSTTWEHSGPLLVELREKDGIVGVVVSNDGWECYMGYHGTSDHVAVGGDTGPHAIARAYVISKLDAVTPR